MKMTNPEDWAKCQFGHANLNDPRRTQRLVSLATSISQHPGVAVSRLPLSPAQMEGAYRFIRNENIQASDIAEAGFHATMQQAQEHDTLLALEDTTSLTYKHESVREELGHTNQGNKNRAILAHSILLFAPQSQQVVGLIEQQRWTRDITKRGQRHQHATRAYEDKESYKWEQASTYMSARLGEHINKVISVCDREADLFEYLTYKTEQKQRFVVRSMQSRCIQEHAHKLYDYSNTLPLAATKSLFIPQKGGRKAREVMLEVRYARVTLKAPANKRTQADIPLSYVSVIEQSDSEEKLAWHLLTSEPITCSKEALKVVSYYERRWLIEDYHKVWKSSGTAVEQLRMQSRDNLERMSVILAFIATRLLQLRFIKACKEEVGTQCCETVLGQKAWKLLWLKMEATPLPKQCPDMLWAYDRLARLGGWKDTKRTGRACVKILWEGWFKLQTILEGYELAISLEHNDL